VWAITMGVVVATIGWQWLQWRFRRYVLTTHRVMTAAGVIHRSIYETSLLNLRQTRIDVSVSERCVGIGSLLMATSGTAFYDTVWTMLSDPAFVQRRVQDQLRRANRLKAA
jgi:hypothetical protein